MSDKHERPVRIIYIIMFVILAATVLPIWYLGRYQTLSLDDYYFGTMTHAAWVFTHSLKEVFKAACEQVRFYYFAKQATYSSVFLMSFFPGVWNENLYFPVPFILSSMIIGSITALTHTVISDCMGIKNRYLTGIVNMILIFIVIQTIPVPHEAIFWYNGALHYVFMESLMIFEAALILHGMHTSKKSTRILTVVFASLLGLIVGGGNLVTGLQACILTALHVAILIMGARVSKKEGTIIHRIGIRGYDRKNLWFLIPEILTVAGYMVNITAPGNAERQASAVQMNPVMAILRSFYAAVTHGFSWLTPMTVFGIILITFIMAYLASHAIGSYLHPLLMAAVSICVFAAMFTPTFYAMSEDAPSRIMNIIYIVEFLLIFLNIANDTGYLYTVSRAEEGCGEFFRLMFEITGNALPRIIIAGSVLIFAVFIFAADKNEYVSMSAVRSIANGEAARYHAQSLERIRILSADLFEQEVTIPAYTEDARPYLLFKEDIGNEPGDEGYWQNVEMSGYYGKTRITVVSP